MGKVLEEYDFNWARRTAEVLPFDEWFDGRIHMLTQGEDFESAISTIQTRIREEANKRGISVKTRKHGDNEIVVQADVEYKAPAKPRASRKR